jgi:hypothetical protein
MHQNPIRREKSIFEPISWPPWRLQNNHLRQLLSQTRQPAQPAIYWMTVEAVLALEFPILSVSLHGPAPPPLNYENLTASSLPTSAWSNKRDPSPR